MVEIKLAHPETRSENTVDVYAFMPSLTSQSPGPVTKLLENVMHFSGIELRLSDPDLPSFNQELSDEQITKSIIARRLMKYPQNGKRDVFCCHNLDRDVRKPPSA